MQIFMRLLQFYTYIIIRQSNICFSDFDKHEDVVNRVRTYFARIE